MRSFSFVILLFCVFSCSGKRYSFSTESELEEYVNDPSNGYISSVESSGFLIETRLVPAVSGEKHPQLTVHMRISRKDGGSVLGSGNAESQEVLQREGYFSFEMPEDVFLEDAGKIHQAVFHHYERNYGLKPSTDIFFQFNHFTPEGDVSFVYRDELLGMGMVRIPLNQALFTICHVEN